MIRESKKAAVAAKLGFSKHVSDDAASNKIWILANDNILVQTVRATSQCFTGPWLISGDFNVTLSPEDRLGGPSHVTGGMSKFLDMVNDTSLIDMGFSDWQWAFPVSIVSHLTCTHSDHSPLLLTLHQDPVQFPHPFRFQRMSTIHEDFIQVVSDCWSNEVTTTPMYRFYIKMKSLNSKLKAWNLVVFGDVNKKVQEA
ncbi:uncharacterized protein LOC131226729 [Magnolia sinica]|uniref:uncharacterized protein LOC131226729 n=1 Tax=Magnolia sinica TaxID=86752 RepID=UPI002659C607|nr:uncharacterized protein LOC131226729 [Magnolia sinica]